jgi:hypothetical protein
MLDTTFETGELAHSLTNDFHRCLLHNHAVDPPWLFDNQGPNDIGAQLQTRQDTQVGTCRAILAGSGGRGEHAGSVSE